MIKDSTLATTAENKTAEDSPDTPLGSNWVRWVGVFAFVYLLLVGVSVVGAGFKWISGGEEGARAIFAFASNPIVGVILGTLATALVQSSSTVTSVIVGLVAGGVPVAVAVPMILGANMGTTITNTFVSLGSLQNRRSFSRAFEASTVHDFFNLFAIAIFLPIEVMFHPLERIGRVISVGLVGDFNASIKGMNFVSLATKPLVNAIHSGLETLPGQFGASLMILVGIGMILFAVFRLGSLLRKVMSGPAKKLVETAIGRGPIAGISSGALVTVLVQSSSTTTSLVVPLAGAGVLSTKQIYRFTLGANIGTCVTAVLAATAVNASGAAVAMQIAIVHLLFNFCAVILFMVIPFLHDLPLRSAGWLGRKVEHSRVWAIYYIGSVFFGLPSLVLGMQVLIN